MLALPTEAQVYRWGQNGSTKSCFQVENENDIFGDLTDIDKCFNHFKTPLSYTWIYNSLMVKQCYRSNRDGQAVGESLEATAPAAAATGLWATNGEKGVKR